MKGPEKVDVFQENQNSSMAVDVVMMDSLMNLAGELVLGRNQLLQAVGSGDKRVLETTSQRIDLVTSELQEQVMRTRMQPISNVLDKISREMEKMAGNLGKEVELSVTGKEVELDKTIIESICDPLILLVRNAVENSIETPEARQTEGKARTGRIRINAYHETGQVNIEVSDDGKGLDSDKVVSRAIEIGLVDKDRVASLLESEKLAFVLTPGFNTDLERNGLELIKAKLENIGGNLDLESRPGKGTAFRIKLPVTLAIIPSQIVILNGDKYAIPQVNLSELLRIPAHQVKDRIERVASAHVIRLRNELLPLVHLADVLKTCRTYFHPEARKTYPERRKNISDRRKEKKESAAGIYEGAEKREAKDRRYRSDSAINVAVVSTGQFKYGLIVDALYDAEEIVVKPLGKHFRTCSAYAGATIMGDGRVALILDVAGIARLTQLTACDPTGQTGPNGVDFPSSEAGATQEQSYLLFRNAHAEQFAVPLDIVERIEKVQAKNIEYLGGRRLLKHRGLTLPVVVLEDALSVSPLPDIDYYQVICFNLMGRDVGLLATPPVDAAELKITLDTKTLRQEGVFGSAIINDETTLLIDMPEIVKTLHPEWCDMETGSI